MEEILYCALIDNSSDIYEDTDLYLRGGEDQIKKGRRSIPIPDVYHDTNVYLQDYYRKHHMSNAFMPSSSCGGRDAINDEKDILTTIT